MTATAHPTCKVCHQPLGENDQYLVRPDARGMTFVHRSVCFPPARSIEPKPVQRAAA